MYMSIYRARLRNTSNALSPRVSGEQLCLQVPPKLFGVDSWIPQTIGQWIPDCWSVYTEKARIPYCNGFQPRSCFASPTIVLNTKRLRNTSLFNFYWPAAAGPHMAAAARTSVPRTTGWKPPQYTAYHLQCKPYHARSITLYADYVHKVA